MSLSVYLAAPYVRRDVVLDYASELKLLGFDVICRWLTSEGEPGNGGDLDESERVRQLLACLEDVGKATCTVVFTAAALGVEGPVGHSGGRHIETGYALAHSRRVLLIGEPENIFGWHPGIARVPDWHCAVLTLGSWLVQHERDIPHAVEATS